MDKKRFNVKKYASVIISVTASMLVVSLTVFASTTIGDNISTDGTLTVGGLSTLTGYVTTASSTAVAQWNLSGTLNASSTILAGSGVTFYGNLTFDKSATTTVSLSQTGLNFDSNTFVIDPNANRVGVLTATPSTALDVVGTASSSGLVVGGGGGGSTITGIVMGTCTFPTITIAASSTGIATCASATGLVIADKVFVSATGSLPTNFTIQAASSTAAATISLRIYNTGYQNATPVGSSATGVNTLVFWATR